MNTLKVVIGQKIKAWIFEIDLHQHAWEYDNTATKNALNSSPIKYGIGYE